MTIAVRRSWIPRLDRSVWIGVAILSILILVAIVAPWIAPADPAKVDPANRLAGPTLDHPLGTDNLGRDTLSRLVFGARVSLGTALLAGTLIAAIGLTVGLLSGYVGGWLFDDVVMRIVDIVLAFPVLILALAITGTMGGGPQNLIIGLVAVWWASYARYIRSLTLQIRDREYVKAATAVGAPHWWILVRHILPNLIPSVIVLGTLDLGRILLALAGLSFLGLGVQPPTPEWGVMLNEARPFLDAAPGLMLAPGLCITITAVAVNILGDGLRDWLDPRLRT